MLSCLSTARKTKDKLPKSVTCIYRIIYSVKICKKMGPQSVYSFSFRNVFLVNRKGGENFIRWVHRNDLGIFKKKYFHYNFIHSALEMPPCVIKNHYNLRLLMIKEPNFQG